MLTFKVYQEEKFIKIIEKIYKIKRIKIFDNAFFNSITTFFHSENKKGSVFNMPFNFYYSPNIKKEFENDFFKKLNIFSKTVNKNVIIKSMLKYNYKKRIHYANNPILKLEKDYKDIFKNFSKNLKKNIKRNINKAERYKIIIEKATDINELKNFYKNIFSMIYINKHKMIFQPLKLFIDLFNTNLLDFFVAKKDKKIIGGLLCIKDSAILHYNWGASFNIHNIAIGTLLINFAIQYAIQNNYIYFDLGSTPISDVHLYNFKMRWGAKNYPVYVYYTLYKPRLIDLNKDYKSLRTIYAKLPNPFIRWIIPKIIPWIVQ